MNWYLDVLKKYAVFNGRATRQEYWMFFLFNMIIGFVLGIIEGLTGMARAGNPGILSSLYTLAILVPSLAVGARRLHDTGKSGWLQLLGLIPILGFIALIVLFALQGQTGENKYGSDPRAVTA